MQATPTLARRFGPSAAQLVEALITSVADALYVVDADGRVQFANPAALAILGYDDEAELLGRLSHATIHYQYPDGTAYPEQLCPMLTPRLTGETVRVDEDWFTRRDGRLVPVAYSSAPLELDTGRGAVVAFRDISQQRAAEEAQRREAVARARAQAAEASRARLAAAAHAERRRLGRDLHDGAQQGLLHVLLRLQAAATADGSAQDELTEAIGATRTVLEELRAFGEGLHPHVLTSRGLAAAVDSLAARAPAHVDLDVPEARYDEAVEATAYYVVAEALANVAKHAPAARRVTVGAQPYRGALRVTVTDDGPGGADPGGSGLAGLADRVAAAGGALEVTSPAGGPTTVAATIPLRPVSAPGGASAPP